MASLYIISGSGFAKANTIGSRAILLTISLETTPPFDKPTKTSAPFITSDKPHGSCSCANSAFSGVRFSLDAVIKPLESHINKCSEVTPKERYSFAQEIAEAPAPLKTTFTSAMFLSAISRALRSAAEVMIAVPCWSSCMTGIFSSSFNLFSM